jgi:outer membrane protein TolC
VRAERAIAETQVIQAEQAVAVAQATLTQMLGAKASLVAGPLLEAPAAAPESTNVAKHPLILEQNAAINEVKARAKALNRAYFPKFNLQAAEFARGTGARVDGSTGSFASGIGPNFQNWALGMSVTFPIMDFKSLREKKEIEVHNERAESARYDKIGRELNGQVERAKAQLEGARRIADTIPVQHKAASDTLEQATARYKSGLGTLIEVAEAQRLLTQVEIDDSLAKLNIWRAMLAVATAQGDLRPFLDRSEGK